MQGSPGISEMDILQMKNELDFAASNRSTSYSRYDLVVAISSSGIANVSTFDENILFEKLTVKGSSLTKHTILSATVRPDISDGENLKS